MHLTKHLFTLLCLTFLIPNAWASENQIVLEKDIHYHNIGLQISLLEDPTHALTISEIQNRYLNQFKSGTHEIPTYGLKNISVWLKVELNNLNQLEELYALEIAYPTFDSIHYYIVQENEIVTSGLLGDRFPFHDRNIDHKNFVIPVDISTAEITTIFIRIRNKGSLILPINVLPMQQVYADDLMEELGYGIFYGIMLVMLLYNLVLAYAARSINYVYYVGIILGNLLTLSALNGHAFKYLWYANPWWANHVIVFGIGLWILAGNLFAARFLDTKKYFPRYHWVFRIMRSIGLLIMILSLTIDYSYSLTFSNYALIINCIVLFISGLYFWYKKVKVASIFTLAWTAYLFGVLLYTLRNLGFLPANDITAHVLEFGAVTEVILLSISLGYKYRLMELDKNTAQNTALDLMARSQELIQRQNEELEKMVGERTSELQQKQDEILFQNEELNIKNDRLTEAQTIIEAQNLKLIEYNDDLESQVAKRTDDLKKTNTELAQNVQKLEQYAFMTAHNLRAPVARLLGLTHLLELNPDTDTAEWLTILSKIKEEGNSLDAVIKDMNAIIELRKDGDKSFEEVNLLEKLNQVKRILKNSIELSGATISFDNSGFNTMKNNPTFVESIFYNLISNAIKYRSDKRPAKINIKTELQADQQVISFEDNGVGIDLKQNQTQLFGMYQRFHNHVEGKGLGLYLVKSQMDILGGEIKVESQPDKGTKFILIFPIIS